MLSLELLVNLNLMKDATIFYRITNEKQYEIYITKPSFISMHLEASIGSSLNS